MPVCFTSDIQARSHQARSRILPNGRNSRLQNALDCLEQAAQLAGQGGTLVINGDLFDDRFKLDIDVMDAVTETILHISKRCLIIIVPGNHDQFLRDGRINSLRIFEDREHITVVPPEGCSIKDREHTCVLWIFPFTEDNHATVMFARKAASLAQNQPGLKHFLVLHAPVQSALLGNGEADTSGVPVQELQCEYFVAVILGHYHKPQQVAEANIFYVGSPYQINTGERGDIKRFLVWADERLESVPVVGMPRFLQVSTLAEAEAHPNDFVDLVCEPIEGLDRLPQNVVFTPKIEAPDEQAIAKAQAGLVNFDVGEAVATWLTNNQGADCIEEGLKRIE